jgi:hypothetical protein
MIQGAAKLIFAAPGITAFVQSRSSKKEFFFIDANNQYLASKYIPKMPYYLLFLTPFLDICLLETFIEIPLTHDR